jgi:histone-lysine N-methyltransferase SETMAR
MDYTWSTCSTSTKKKSFGKKVMLSVWWNSEGMVHFEMIPNGRSITAALYCQQLDRVQESLRLNYPALVNRNQVVFLQNNAKPHTALLTRAKLDELGWEVLSHPPYSPDLAPSDYHLFRSMEHFLRGREFEVSTRLKLLAKSFLTRKSPSSIVVELSFWDKDGWKSLTITANI